MFVKFIFNSWHVLLSFFRFFENKIPNDFKHKTYKNATQVTYKY